MILKKLNFKSLSAPINEDCLAEGLVVGKVVVAKMPTCSSLNRIDVSSEYDCGVCAEGYVEDTDENSRHTENVLRQLIIPYSMRESVVRHYCC